MEKVRKAVKELREKGYLVSPRAIDKLKDEEDPLKIVKEMKEKTTSSKAIIEPSDLEKQKKDEDKNDEKTENKNEQEVEVKGSLNEIIAKQYESKVKILNKDIS
ncbi:MAG: hypothetical protein ACOCTT_03615, partial [archaeon]